jgi:hypothetical protein
VTDGRRPRVAVLADDLNWATRLASIVRRAGAEATTVATADAFAATLPTVDAVIVDLGLRSGEANPAIAAAVAAGRTVVAVGPHEATAVRRAAMAAGARRVYAYRKLFDDGPRTIAAWLGLPDPTGQRPADDAVPTRAPADVVR